MKKFIIIAVVLFVLLIVAVAGMGWFAFREVEKIGQQVLQENPVVQEHIGAITEIDFDVMKTGELGRDDTIVFNVTGEKGSGTATVSLSTTGAGEEKVTDGTLEVTGGETYSLVAPAAEESPGETAPVGAGETPENP